MSWVPLNYDLPAGSRPGGGNVSAITADLAGPAEGKIPTPDQLDSWDQEQYLLSQSAALSLGFAMGDIDAKGSRVVVVAGMSHYAEVEDASGARLRYGVALRMTVHVTSVNLDIKASLPVLAAQAQLGQVQTETTLSIRGYNGSVQLPRFQTLSVENYGDYMKAVSDLQDLLSKSSDGIKPVLLARLLPDPTLSDIEVAAAEVWALSEITKGKSQAEARSRFPDADQQELISRISQVYADLGIEGDSVPNEEQRAKAHVLLHGVVPRTGIFGR